VRNAIKAYEKLTKWRPTSQQDLLAAHQTLMQGLIDDVGQYRNNNSHLDVYKLDSQQVNN
jgi:Fic family protein